MMTFRTEKSDWPTWTSTAVVLHLFSFSSSPLLRWLWQCWRTIIDILPQIGVFVYHVLILTNQGKGVGPNGPAYTKVQTSEDYLKKTSLLFLASSKVWQFSLGRDRWSSIQQRKRRFGDFSHTSLFTVDTFTSASTSSSRYPRKKLIQVPPPHLADDHHCHCW